MSLLNSVLPLSSPRNKQNGFTLLETLLYMTLFGSIIGNLVFIGAMVEKNNTQSSFNLSTQQQADFIISKLKWLIDNNLVVTPTTDSSGSTLTLISPDGSSSTIVKINNARLEIESTETTLPITTAPDTVNDFLVHHSVDHKLNINFSLNGQQFNFSKLATPAP